MLGPSWSASAAIRVLRSPPQRRTSSREVLLKAAAKELEYIEDEDLRKEILSTIAQSLGLASEMRTQGPVS